MNWSSLMYSVALSVGVCWSGLVEMPLFQDEFTNGTSLTMVAAFTPGRARRIARSLRVRASALSSAPTPAICTRTSSSSTMPLTSFRRSSRLLIRNSALQTIAQLSAISSTISAAAVLWRERVDRMGRISMGVSRVAAARAATGVTAT